MNVAVVGVTPVVGEAGWGLALPRSMERERMWRTMGVSGGEGGNLNAPVYAPRSREWAMGDVANEKSFLNGDSLEKESRRRLVLTSRLTDMLNGNDGEVSLKGGGVGVVLCVWGLCGVVVAVFVFLVCSCLPVCLCEHFVL